MALRTAVLFASAVADIKASETSKFRGMAALALVILNNSHWSDKPTPHAELRASLLHVATTQCGIEGPTWQAYAKGMDTMAGKFASHFGGREFVLSGEGDDAIMCVFDDIRDMDEADAIDAVLALFVNHGVTSGGQIRDWAKQEGFAPFDADLVKRQRKEALEAKRKGERDAAAALIMAHVGTDSSTLPNQDLVATVASFDPMALVAGLDQAQADALVVALNAHMATLAARAAAMVAEPSEPPVLADTVDETKLPNKPRKQRAAKLVDLQAEAA